jgi:hypothetical protein
LIHETNDRCGRARDPSEFSKRERGASDNDWMASVAVYDKQG